MRVLQVFVVMLLSAEAVGEVTEVSDRGFVSAHVLHLNASPGRAYQALTGEVARWWDASHSYSGAAANFTLDARAGGCFCEVLPGGGSVEHMRVVFADPGRLLRLQGGLGPLQAMAVNGIMAFSFQADEQGGTRLEYRYEVSGGVTSLKGLAGPVDQVQLGQLQRLATFLSEAPAR